MDLNFVVNVLSKLNKEKNSMRQWLVDPKMLCRKHLLGEHVETHMFIGTLLKGNSIQGYIDKGLYEPSKVYSRHQELVEEMNNRGYKHKSELPFVDIPKIQGKVNIQENIEELKRRCPECKKRIEELKY
jgi:hypothetical protein